MKTKHLEKDRVDALHEIEEMIEYRFKDLLHIDRALTHSSYRNHLDNVNSYRNMNECMEFLGDAVLDFVISEYLYNVHTDWDEGELSKFRSKVICEQSLAIVAAKLELWKYILVGKGECHTDKMNQSIMADAVEAIIAAVYLDGGIVEAKACIMRFLTDNIKAIEQKKILRDSKTELQELVQHVSGASVKYVVTEKKGPQHDSVFTVNAILNGNVIGSGKGKNKKEAEQAAAAVAIEKYEKDKNGRDS